MSASIPIVDDETDENDQQIFLVFLEVVNATNINLVENIERNFSQCNISDNDRECT